MKTTTPKTTASQDEEATFELQANSSSSTSATSEGRAGTATLKLSGRLGHRGTAKLWVPVTEAVSRQSASELIVDATDLAYCDGSGMGLLVQLAESQRQRGASFELRNASEDVRRLWQLLGVDAEAGLGSDGEDEPASFLTRVGRSIENGLEQASDSLTYLGEILLTCMTVLRHPSQIRWKDTLIVAEKVGSNAVFLIALIGFLLGLILSFESANLMKRYGAEIYVADLVAVSVLRELGPLMTAIVLAGRSGSAFAAELGTMKINEELDALTTMGLDPNRFLVFPRLLAGICMMPLLTLFLNAFALLGALMVLMMLGFPAVTFINQVLSAVDTTDLLGGLFKACVLGSLVAGIGCLRGLQTKSGATAVGDSTTSAVVSAIVIVAVVDGIFSVVYYNLGI